MRKRSQIAGVYLLTPDAEASDYDRVLRVVDAALDAGVRLVQYRNKCADAQTRRRQAARLLSAVRAAGGSLIINDHVELAIALGADGVHLGRDDGDLSHARSALGDRLLGASCYDSLDRASSAVEAGADAIAFGAMFASTTKPDAVRAPLMLLGQARHRWPQVRVVAIGGIDRDNIAQVAAAGAHAAALMTAVFGAPDPAAAARALIDEFNQAAQRPDAEVAGCLSTKNGPQ